MSLKSQLDQLNYKDLEYLKQTVKKLRKTRAVPSIELGATVLMKQTQGESINVVGVATGSTIAIIPDSESWWLRYVTLVQSTSAAGENGTVAYGSGGTQVWLAPFVNPTNPSVISYPDQIIVGPRTISIVTIGGAGAGAYSVSLYFVRLPK